MFTEYVSQADADAEPIRYHAHPFRRGGAWHDWALVDLGPNAKQKAVPCHLMFFLRVTGLSSVEPKSTNDTGIDEDGDYAFVHRVPENPFHHKMTKRTPLYGWQINEDNKANTYIVDHHCPFVAWSAKLDTNNSRSCPAHSLHVQAVKLSALQSNCIAIPMESDCPNIYYFVQSRDEWSCHFPKMMRSVRLMNSRAKKEEREEKEREERASVQTEARVQLDFDSEASQEEDNENTKQVTKKRKRNNK